MSLQKNKVLFLTEGSDRIGLGHIGRCLCLADVFSEKGWEVVFYIRGRGKLEIDYQYQYTCWDDINSIRHRLKEYNLIVVDSYEVDKHKLNEISKLSAISLFIIDSKLNYGVGGRKNFLLYGSVYGEEVKGNDKATVLAGPEYMLFKKHFWNIPSKKISRSVKNVVINIGSGRQDILRSLLQKLIENIKSVFGDIQVVVLGNFENSIKEGYTNNVMFKFLQGQQYVSQLFMADLIISNGGQSLNEAVAIGGPCIAFSTADNQNKNLASWGKLGGIGCCGSIFKSDFDIRLGQMLQRFSKYEERQTSFNKSENIIDTQGAKRVYDAIIKHVK